MYDRILVPTDGSDHAVAAAKYAFELAGALGADVDVVSVVDVQGAAGPFSAGGIDQEFLGRLESEAEAAIEAVEALGEEEQTVHTATMEGAPGETLVEYVSDHGVDLVVMGTRGRSGLKRYVLGSVTERVLRHAPVPVFTTRVTAVPDDPTFDRVVVPTDGSETAELAVAQAVTIARAFDATVHAISVVDIGRMAAQSDMTPATAIYDRLKEGATEATETVAERAGRADVDVVTEVREGFPASEILDYTAETDGDLIVMGTRGHTGVERFLLGSTTERAVRNADTPVLAVRKPE
jgi:nucleotide-binding universal stress UspA family protein